MSQPPDKPKERKNIDLNAPVTGADLSDILGDMQAQWNAANNAQKTINQQMIDAMTNVTKLVDETRTSLNEVIQHINANSSQPQQAPQPQPQQIQPHSSGQIAQLFQNPTAIREFIAALKEAKELANDENTSEATQAALDFQRATQRLQTRIMSKAANIATNITTKEFSRAMKSQDFITAEAATTVSDAVNTNEPGPI